MLGQIERWRDDHGLIGRAARAIDVEALEAAGAAGYLRQREAYYLNITYPSLQSMGPLEPAHVEERLVGAAGKPVALYVHVPFCSAQCAYCHYFKLFRPAAETVSATVTALVAEVGLLSRRMRGLRYRAVYVGGGTPSYLPVEDIRALFAGLYRHGQREPGCEVSFEVHPENATAELLEELASLGVTRVSMGVESLDDEVLKRENRRHTVEQAVEAHDRARRAGFRSVNLDLIYGMEDQTVVGWRDTVERLAGLRPDSATAYQLRLRTHSAALNRYHKEPSRFASADETLLMHAVTQQALVREGDYREDPVDWYVRQSQPVHDYQTLNWRDTDAVPLLGVGPSAYSYVEGCQYYNVNDLPSYLHAIGEGQLIPFRGEVLDHEERWRRACVLGLKMGLHLPSLELGYGGTAVEGARAAASVPMALGLIIERAGWLRLSATGALIADEVARCFSSPSMARRAASLSPTVISTTSRKLNPDPT